MDFLGLLVDVRDFCVRLWVGPFQSPLKVYGELGLLPKQPSLRVSPVLLFVFPPPHCKYHLRSE